MPHHLQKAQTQAIGKWHRIDDKEKKKEDLPVMILVTVMAMIMTMVMVMVAMMMTVVKEDLPVMMV